MGSHSWFSDTLMLMSLSSFRHCGGVLHFTSHKCGEGELLLVIKQTKLKTSLTQKTPGV